VSVAGMPLQVTTAAFTTAGAIKIMNIELNTQIAKRLSGNFFSFYFCSKVLIKTKLVKYLL
jgi:hypothetical protein